MSVAAAEARTSLLDLVQRVNSDETAIEIKSKYGSALLMSKHEYDSMLETAFLLGTPKNARRLFDAIEQARLH